MKVKNAVFSKKSIRSGDVLYLKEMTKEPKKVKEGNNFVEVSGEYVWWLNDYDIITDFKEFRFKENTNDN